MLLRLFQRQVADQCTLLLHGAHVAHTGLQALLHRVHVEHTGPQARDQDAIWVGMQTLVTGAGNVSKALWGSGGKLVREREPLRRSLQVPDSSPFQDVSMRNHFEHFDERLDRWWQRSPPNHHWHIDREIGPPSKVGGEGVSEWEMFRVYDPSTAELFFWGERFDVRAIVIAAEELHPRAVAEASKRHWEE
jgi:hypothetical protein